MISSAHTNFKKTVYERWSAGEASADEAGEITQKHPLRGDVIKLHSVIKLAAFQSYF